MFGFGALVFVRRLPGKASAAVVAVTLVGLLALALGVALIVSRHDGGEGASVDGRGDQEPEASIERARDLLDEALREARAVLPDAELVFVAYSTPSGLYTFRFSQPGTLAEVSILGPYRNDPAFPRWERIPTERPAGSPALASLDLSAMQNDFLTVAEAAAARSPSSTENMGLALFSDDGVLIWATTARLSADLLVQCEAPDADLSLMICDDQLPPAITPTPLPTP